MAENAKPRIEKPVLIGLRGGTPLSPGIMAAVRLDCLDVAILKISFLRARHSCSVKT